MDSIKDIIPDVISQMSLHKAGATRDIQTAWSRIAGGSGSRVAELKEGVLIVYVDTTIRMASLNIHKEDFLKQLHKEFPTITKICFKVAKI